MQWRDDSETRYVGAEIPSQLWRAMKQESLNRGCPMKQLLREALGIVYGGGADSEPEELVRPQTGVRMVPPIHNRIKL